MYTHTYSTLICTYYPYIIYTHTAHSYMYILICTYSGRNEQQQKVMNFTYIQHTYIYTYLSIYTVVAISSRRRSWMWRVRKPREPLLKCQTLVSSQWGVLMRGQYRTEPPVVLVTCGFDTCGFNLVWFWATCGFDHLSQAPRPFTSRV
jgi:hypothetical protein